MRQPAALCHLCSADGRLFCGRHRILKAVQTMGALAEQWGYDDAAESLMVTDKEEAFIFQIMPDDTARSALWVVRQRRSCISAPLQPCSPAPSASLQLCADTRCQNANGNICNDATSRSHTAHCTDPPHPHRRSGCPTITSVL